MVEDLSCQGLESSKPGFEGLKEKLNLEQVINKAAWGIIDKAERSNNQKFESNQSALSFLSTKKT